METKTTTAVSAGLIISLILIVLSLIIYFTGLYTETWNQYIGFAVLVGGIIWSVHNHGKEREFTATFGNLFGFGFKVAAVITCLMILYTILSGYLFPDVKETIMEMSRQQALSQPGSNESQIEAGMAMFEKNFTLFIVLGILFWYLIIGAISSLIGAAITKKNQKATFENI